MSEEVHIKDESFPVRGFDVPCRRRDGQKPKTILLLHGTASAAVNWCETFDALSLEFRTSAGRKPSPPPRLATAPHQPPGTI